MFRKFIRSLRTWLSQLCAFILILLLIGSFISLPSNFLQSNDSASSEETSSLETATVARVIDGDTIVLTDGRKVRYIGINAPETNHPVKPIGCYGQQATDKNNDLVLGKTVQLEKDVSEVDRYGRLLRYVYVDNQMINEILVREGFATATTYPPDVKYMDSLFQAQNLARIEQLGIWSDACSHRSSSTSVN
ncbi:thermonuclease family protein [bacterium]|nr:thermonuclease family protein [bacterium]MBQ6436325.1 thermonuclease family protein [bacterium]